MNFLRGYVRAGIEEARADVSLPVTFVASTEGIKRDGNNLQMEDWDFSRYSKLPVILWSHDMWGDRLPLGRGDLRFEGRNLLVDVTYDTADAFAMQVRNKALMGIVGASVQWDEVALEDEAGNRRVVNQLLEISNVPVPLDPDAIPMRERAGLRSLRSALDAVLEEGDPEEADVEAEWTEAATAMVRLFWPSADDAEVSEVERDSVYRALLPKYRRAGKTPPELLPLAKVRALGAREISGLFFNGEPALVPDLVTRAKREEALQLVLAKLDALEAKVDGLLGDGEDDAQEDESPDVEMDEAEDVPGDTVEGDLDAGTEDVEFLSELSELNLGEVSDGS